MGSSSRRLREPSERRTRARSWASVLVALLGIAGVALGAITEGRAQELGRPAGARSLEVIGSGATVRAGPSIGSARRGTVRPGSRIAFEARVRGEGCPGGEWYRLGREQYLCETLVRPSTLEPAGDTLPIVPTGALLPRRHAFVATDGTWAYSRPRDYFLDQYVESLGQGFGVAIVEERSEEGVSFSRSLRGLWIPTRELRFARGSDFEGLELTDGRLDVAWVERDGAVLRAWNGRAPGRVLRRLGRRTVVHVREVVRGRVIVEDAEGPAVLEARDVRRPTTGPMPTDLAPDEAWIDVDVAQQTLVAFVGTRPIFTTLVSTGRPDRAHRTPLGTFHVWAKLAEDQMDDLERTDQVSNYAIEAVPWVQYFSQGVALHAAFWHDDFGRARSHGCVNLSPRDARRLFDISTPPLPPGWDGILTTERQPGERVRVRDGERLAD